MRRWRRPWLAVILATAGYVHAQPLQPDRFEEALNPQVNVSGATRGGVLVGARQRLESLETLTVRVPPETKTRKLCLTLVTRDGRYQARMDFSLPAGTEDFVELNYPSRFKEQLLEANEPYLAVLAGLKSDCDADENVYIPTAWRPPDALSELQLVINAGNLDAHVSVPLIEGGERRFECARIETSPTIAFNRICTIEIADDLDLMGTKVLRDDFFGNPLPPIVFPIAF